MIPTLRPGSLAPGRWHTIKPRVTSNNNPLEGDRMSQRNMFGDRVDPDSTDTHASVEAIEAAMLAGERAAQKPVEASEGEGVTEVAPVDAEARYAQLEAEYAAFKRRVAETAGKYADRHGLCAVTDKALAEIGLRRPTEESDVTLTLKITYRAETSPGKTVTAGEAWDVAHNVAYTLRYSSPGEVARSYASKAATRGMQITASAEITPVDHGPDGHLLPDGQRPAARCGDCDTILDADGDCSYC